MSNLARVAEKIICSFRGENRGANGELAGDLPAVPVRDHTLLFDPSGCGAGSSASIGVTFSK